MTRELGYYQTSLLGASASARWHQWHSEAGTVWQWADPVPTTSARDAGSSPAGAGGSIWDQQKNSCVVLEVVFQLSDFSSMGLWHLGELWKPANQQHLRNPFILQLARFGSCFWAGTENAEPVLGKRMQGLVRISRAYPTHPWLQSDPLETNEEPEFLTQFQGKERWSQERDSKPSAKLGNWGLWYAW